MPRSLYKNTSKMKNQDNMFPPNPTSSTEVFYNENYPEKLQNTELKKNIHDQRIQEL